MSDIDDIEEDKGSIDLLALLYPDDDLSSTSEHEGATLGELGGDLGEELGGEFDALLGLRSLFGAMPEEEPSAAVSNRLLAFAATHAPKPAKAKSPGLLAWFGNLIMPLATHPGLAAAASLVLIAGVAGTLYYKDGGKAAEPMAQGTAQDPATTPSPVSAAEARPAGESADPTEAAPEQAKGESDEIPDRGLGNSLEVSAARASDKAAPVGEASKGRVRSKKQSLSRGAKTKTKPSIEPLQSKPFSEKTSSAEKERKSVSKDSDRNRSVQAQKKNKRAPAKREPGSSRSTVKSPPLKPVSSLKSLSDGLARDFSDSEESPDDDSQPDTKMVSTTKVSALHSQAKIAAKKGDCAAVTRLGRQVQKLDSAYYRRQFLPDASLNACRAGAKPAK